ncbi:hypothetical protein CPB85DRAFT_282629 [Mucidula mucida]|nr:hypothetical protein CPB85DRAFT_282629 [Mucidula mucida]
MSGAMLCMLAMSQSFIRSVICRATVGMYCYGRPDKSFQRHRRICTASECACHSRRHSLTLDPTTALRFVTGSSFSPPVTDHYRQLKLSPCTSSPNPISSKDGNTY